MKMADKLSESQRFLVTDRPPSFFKYTSAETAIKILEAAAFRYSSPLLFNDPFDIQSGLHFDFDVDQLPEKAWERIERLVFQAERPVFSQDSNIGRSIVFMWDKKQTHGFPRHDMRSIFLPSLSAIVAGLVDLQANVQNQWRQNFLPRLRVFSVSENKDNLLMWSHYARDHTGVVFELRVMPEEDNPLCIAQPIRYCRVPPPLFSEQHWLDFILDRSDVDEEALFLEYAYMKSDIWRYENEWRVWDLIPSAEPPFFSPYPIFPNEIGAIYLGCRMLSDKKADILNLLEKYPTARAFQSRKAPSAYRIEFDPL